MRPKSPQKSKTPATLLVWRTSGGVAINPWEVDDMAKAIASIFEPTLRLLLPARGRHRAVPRWIRGVEVAG